MRAARLRKSSSSERADRPRARARSLFRDAILDAAEEEFASAGFHAARVQDIARRAGVAVGTLYNHFGMKEDVLVALLDQRMREMTEALAPAPEDPAKYVDRLCARLTRLLGYRDRHDAFFSLALEHGLLGDATGAARQILGARTLPHSGRFEKVTLDLVDEGIAASAFAAGDRELQAAFLKATFRAVARWARGKGSVTPEETARKMVALFLGGASAAAKARVKASRK
jgi:AcrR family transcriptional regulator